MQVPRQPQLLSTSQVGELLGLTARTVARMVARGDLPGYRICGRILVSGEELGVWLELRRLGARVSVTPRPAGLHRIQRRPGWQRRPFESR